VTDDQRRPVIVGVGQVRGNRDRTVEGAREPLALLLDALRAAGRDAGAPQLLAQADAVYAVRIASWAYDGLARRVADALGAPARSCVDTDLGGHLPVRLLDSAAARIARGDGDVALVVGAEAQASVTLLHKAGVDPVGQLGWSAAPGGPPSFDVDQLGSKAMRAAGLLAPTRVYALHENRLQADLGLTPAESGGESARLYAALSRVAAAQPAAWNREALSEHEVGTVSPANRMVCEPYPLVMNAMPHVDQAAALLVTSLATARAHGIADDAMVHVRSGAGVDDDPDVLARPAFGESPALALALDQCAAAAEVDLDGIDLVDVYSCFPVVPKLVARHLGLPRDTPLSVTGGHSAFGGPLNSYSLHALAAMTERLRGSGRTGLVHANGGYLTYQHAVLLSGSAPPYGYAGDPTPQAVPRQDPVRVVTPDELPASEVDVVVETATVEHDRSGAPSQAFVVTRTCADQRLAVATPAGDSTSASALSLQRLPDGRRSHVGRELRLRLRPDGAAEIA
jgi:acetyl-CoA C-acetyltransferase